MQLPLIGATPPPQLFDARSAPARTCAGEPWVGYEQLVILWGVVHGVRSRYLVWKTTAPPVSGEVRAEPSPLWDICDEDQPRVCRGLCDWRGTLSVDRPGRESGGVRLSANCGTGSLLLRSSVGFVRTCRWGMYQFGGL